MADSVRRHSRAAVLTLGFLVPFVLMALVYTIMKVWPAGDSSVLVLDLNAQYISYLEQLRDIVCSHESILYCFERSLGGEFSGIYAYYLSSPLSFIVCLFSEKYMTEAVYLILLLKCGLCGLSFSWFITECDYGKLKRVFVVMLSTMYALSSFAVVMQNNLMWTDGMIILPVLTIAVDRMIKGLGYKLYTVSVAAALLTNFYIGYMLCIFTFVYFFIRFFSLTKEERGESKFIRTLAHMALFSLIAIGISAVIIVPMYYSLSFGKLTFSSPDFTPEQIYDWLDILTKSFFGVYDTVEPDGLPFVYCGLIVNILVPVYFVTKHASFRRKLGAGILTAFMIVSMNLTTLDLIWHGMQKPNWLNTRFAFILIFILLSITAEALINITKDNAKCIAASAVVWAVIILIIQKLGYDYVDSLLTVWSSLGIIIVLTVLLTYLLNHPDSAVSLALGCTVICELFCNAIADTYFLRDETGDVSRKSYTQLIDDYSQAADMAQEDAGEDALFRSEKQFVRKKNDNYALNINGISGSTSTLNAKVISLLHRMGFNSQSHYSTYTGSTPVSDSILGIDYVYGDSSFGVSEYIMDMYDCIGRTSSRIDVYSNPYSAGMMYTAAETITDFTSTEIVGDEEKDKYTTPFAYLNAMYSALLGHEVQLFVPIDTEEVYCMDMEEYYTDGHEAYLALSDYASVNFDITATEDAVVYAYFPSDLPRVSSLTIDGHYEGTYYDEDSFSIVEIGSMCSGDTIEVSLIPDEGELYLKKCIHFWYLDTEAFTEAAQELSSGRIDTYSEHDDVITAHISADGDELIFTTIPYDKGWKVYIDGEQTETFSTVDGTLLAFRTDGGEHDIVMKYRPSCVIIGCTVSAVSTAAFAGICLIDRKRKKIK